MKIAIITNQESDLSKIISSYAEVDVISPNDSEKMAGYDAYAILGGTEEEPLLLPIDSRNIIEDERAKGKPVFSEWCASMSYYYIDGKKIETIAGRMIWIGDEGEELKKGALLDDRANAFYSYLFLQSEVKPWLAFGGHIVEHDCCKEVPTYPYEKWTIFQPDDNTVICIFKICNYLKARFAPLARWNEIVSKIVSFLVGRKVKVNEKNIVSNCNAEKSQEETFEKGMHWFENVNIYLKDGKDGALEGLKNNILPNGKQLVAEVVRNDCSGEIAGACFFDWYLNKNKKSYERFKNLQNFCFNKLYCKEGKHLGLMRWSTASWGICYQDDVARAMLGTLLCMEMTDDRDYLDRICLALDYALQTTGTDGLRKARTDADFLTEEKYKELSQNPSNFTCAHHNAYYLAVLMMVYRLTGEKRYYDVAVKGMNSLMKVFPDTIREHSETQELCRLIFPLAVMYDVTKDEQYKQWLYLVADRLERYRHKSGSYCEYDTDYRAARSRTAGTESSLLANNGDPVSDLLYSVNWLPLGFAYAFKATGDKVFEERYLSLIKFLSKIQTVSDDKNLDGCWFRGIDLERYETYGMPHDVGWGTCAVESGWTMAEILMGIGYYKFVCESKK